MGGRSSSTSGRWRAFITRPPSRWARGVDASIRRNASAYGYSVLVTTTFGLLQGTEGPPTSVDLFLYVVGAGVTFAGLGALTSRLFREEPEDESELVVVVGGSLNVFAVATGLGAAFGTAQVVGSHVAWGLVPAVATFVYLLSAGLQMGAVERAEEGDGNRGSDR